jgi:hypothetical protein
MADKEREKKIAPKVPKPNYQMWIIWLWWPLYWESATSTESGELVEITKQPVRRYGASARHQATYAYKKRRSG